MKNQDLKAFKQTAKDYPIILTKPFFHFGWSLAKIQDKFKSRSKNGKILSKMW